VSALGRPWSSAPGEPTHTIVHGHSATAGRTNPAADVPSRLPVRGSARRYAPTPAGKQETVREQQYPLCPEGKACHRPHCSKRTSTLPGLRSARNRPLACERCLGSGLGVSRFGSERVISEVSASGLRKRGRREAGPNTRRGAATGIRLDVPELKRLARGSPVQAGERFDKQRCRPVDARIRNVKDRTA